MSMKPGATTQPEASSSRAPCRSGPISSILPAVMATSARRPGPPLPSITVPPRMAISAGISTSVAPRQQELGLIDRRSGGGSTVHRDDDPGDLGGSLTGQEQDGVGHVDGSALALQRLGQLDDPAEVVVGDAGGDVARGDAVDPDGVLGPG